MIKVKRVCTGVLAGAMIVVLLGCNPADEESVGVGSADEDMSPAAEQRPAHRASLTGESHAGAARPADDLVAENAKETRREEGGPETAATEREFASDGKGGVAREHDDPAVVTRTSDVDASELVAAIGGEDAVARFLAEEQLVGMGDDAVAALKPLATSSGYAPARQYTIIVLARIGSERSIRLLLEILEEEPDVWVRALICRHLGRLGVEEAVPIIGKWLYSIRGKSFEGWYPGVSKPTLAWLEHVYALREIGSEKAIPILEEMRKTKHGGRGGPALRSAYQVNLTDLKSQAEFWRAVRRVPGLEPQARMLFDFFRKDTLALIRLYRDKVVRGGLEGQWVLEDMKNHPDEKLREAAAAVLSNYGELQVQAQEDQT